MISIDLEKDILLFSGFDEKEAFDNFFILYENWELKEERVQELTRHTLSKVLEEIKNKPEKFLKSKSLISLCLLYMDMKYVSIVLMRIIKSFRGTYYLYIWQINITLMIR